ncbi:MAG: insulinase family protein [Chitinophagales bacterium]|nr:insulinase family protein [Chitinophagales bacterium]MDW8427135.1 pitrilysin family protein [Chitinophagales bacterium]
MITYHRTVLNNGLRLIVHQDTTTALAAVNILYNVGSKHEQAHKTGFAHLFEHLMFGGSKNIPVFDEPLQRAGGENNAFTSCDITVYYETLPAANLETAFWLESDRMNELAFSEKALEVQKKVVIEEFKEHYLNQPYGDVWHHLRALAYTIHPYRWPTIGLTPEHIASVTLPEVKDFFYTYYRPNNAILVVAGNVQPDEVFRLAETYFGVIAPGTLPIHQLPTEPPQQQSRRCTIAAKVPVPALYKAWHFPARNHPDFYAADLITDILGAGKSGRLHQQLVMKQQLFSEIHCYHTGSLDPGLLVIEGKLTHGTSIQQAEQAVEQELQKLIEQPVDEPELQKVKNRLETQTALSDTELLNRALNLAVAELLGNANLVNEELERYRAVTAEQILQQARNILRPENCSTLFYLPRRERPTTIAEA